MEKIEIAASLARPFSAIADTKNGAGCPMA